MNSNKKTARIVGALFLTGYLFIGTEFLQGPILNAPDYLINLYPNKTRVIIGLLLELIMGGTVVGIAVMMFPIFDKQNKNIALGYVGFRILECAFIIVGAISLLSLITLSQEFVKAGAPDASYFQTLGTLLLAERSWANVMVRIIFSPTALVFYYLLYQSKLIPRFISVWGLIGATLALTGTLLEMFGSNLLVILFLPGGLNELFLGVWLIVKGFNSPAIASESAKTDINED